MLPEPRTPPPTDLTTDPSPPEKPGRDAKGRFAPGNRFGQGGPFAGRVAELRRLLLRKVQKADLEQIVEVLLTKAKEGNLTAIMLCAGLARRAT